MRSLLFPVVTLIWSLVSPLRAQSLEHENYALFFAVNEYDHLPALTNPISNAEAIADILASDYGFHTEIVKNPDRAQIRAKLEEYKRNFQDHLGGQYPYEGQLLIFFSGHGEKEYDNGFFIPTDADPSDLQATALDYVYFRSFINSINCQHILVAIDACYSVRFDPLWATRSNRSFNRPGESGERSQIIAGHQEKVSRIFFTSDGEEEQTPDRSNFARKFQDGLLTYGHDGLLTSSKLYGELANAVPKPHTGYFGDDQPGSSFLFIRTSTEMDPEDVAAWNEASARNTVLAYRAYQSAYPNGKFFALAQEKIQEIKQREETAADINAWRRAERLNTREAYLYYLEVYPAGAFVDFAYKELDKLNADIPNGMVLVDGGSFRMGDAFGDGGSDELPLHEVSLDNFLIGQYEVSVADFQLFVGETGYRTTADKEGGSYVWNEGSGRWGLQEGVNWRHDATGRLRPGYENIHPVIHVSWLDAIEYCNWKSRSEHLDPAYEIRGDLVTWSPLANGYRLPTEAEWEFAARSGGKGYQYGWGNEIPTGNLADEEVNKGFAHWAPSGRFDDGYPYTAPVGQFSQGEIGLYSITGNVAEWCWDWYVARYYEDPNGGRSPKGPDQGYMKAIRGGSWFGNPENGRASNRDFERPTGRNGQTGFRIARNL